jgi:hypothetical protein
MEKRKKYFGFGLLLYLLRSYKVSNTIKNLLTLCLIFSKNIKFSKYINNEL